MQGQKERGITLLELVLVIVILGIIAIPSSALLTQSALGIITGENVANANWQAQIAVQRMTRDIRLIRSQADITNALASTFTFYDTSGNLLSYTLTGTNLILIQNGNAEILAEGVQSLTFTYYDQTGTVVASTALIQYVGFTLNITQGGVNYSISTVVYPRNVL